MNDDLNDAPVTADESSKKYKKLQLRLQETERLRKSKVAAAITAILAILTAAICLTAAWNQTIPAAYNVAIAVGAGVFVGAVTYLCFTVALMSTESDIRRKLIDCETVTLQDALSDTDPYNDLVKLNYKYLDQYYLQTREQTQRGFIATMVVSLFGALLIGAGVIAIFLGATDSAYVTSASGIVTEFISAVFFYLYNKTVSSMRNYHNKLVMAQNISIALAAADSLPEEKRTEAKMKIIDELIKNLNEYFFGGNRKKQSESV